MKAGVKLGAVLLAAGKSQRFGSNKLLADFDGRPVICRALEAMKAAPAQRACVVTGDGDVAVLARAYGFDVTPNHEPQRGQAHSIYLGISCMQDMDAVLLMAGDQPLLTGKSLLRLVDAYLAGEKGIACLRDETHMGNPAVFSARYMPQLLALGGDRGAKGILKANPQDLLVVDCVHAGELSDADTPQELEKLKNALQI